jgi:GcrA cell cycle regulator
MWNAGKSAAIIGAEFGVSRNVIIGMADRNRDQFPFRMRKPIVRNPERAEKSEKEKTTQKPVQRDLSFDGEMIQETVENEPVSRYEANRAHLAKNMVDLGAMECKWPVGDDRPYMFCAASAAKGHHYCEHHLSRNYRPRGDYRF